MKRLFAATLLALLVTLGFASVSLAQSPEPPATATVSAALTATAETAVAVTPPTAASAPGGTRSGSSMVVTAIVPVPAGTIVHLNVLEGPSLRSIPCDQAASEQSDGLPANQSRVTFTVERSACVAPNSGNLRICWTDTECDNFTFQAGESVDLGLLPRPVVNTPPNAGGGEETRGRGVADTLNMAGYGALAIGLLGFVVGVVAARRRRAR
jgi:hypothetical protein